MGLRSQGDAGSRGAVLGVALAVVGEGSSKNSAWHG